MKIDDLMDVLAEGMEETGYDGDILVSIDGMLYDFEVGTEPESFDGFCTVSPAFLVINPKGKS